VSGGGEIVAPRSIDRFFFLSLSLKFALDRVCADKTSIQFIEGLTGRTKYKKKNGKDYGEETSRQSSRAHEIVHETESFRVRARRGFGRDV